MAYARVSVQAVATRKGRVIRMGRFSEMRELLSPATRVIDLDGEFVQPAFHDAHIHLLHLHHGEGHVDLSGVVDSDGLKDALNKAKTSVTQEQPWLFGWGLKADFASQLLQSNPKLLDELHPGIPSMLRTKDAHGAWISRAGVEFLDPTLTKMLDGFSAYIEEPGGNKGCMHVTERAFGMVLSSVPGADDATTESQLLRRIENMIEQGVAVGHEAMIEQEDLPLLKGLFEKYPIVDTGRLHGMLHARSGSWSWLKERSPEFGIYDGRLSLGTVKVFLDGSLGSGTAWMEPEEPPMGMPPDELREVAQFCLEQGFQLAVHAIGRHAVRVAIDVMEEVRPHVPTPYRASLPVWRIEHAEFVEHADVKRAAEIGIVLSVQPLHLLMDSELLKEQHPGHLTVAFPWLDFTEGGVPLALGSDGPVTPCAPFKNLEVACGPARRELFGVHEAPLALHALARDLALHSHTLGGAVASLGKLGSGMLTVGQNADFIVVDDDPLTCATDQVGKIKVLETWIGGQRAFPKIVRKKVHRSESGSEPGLGL
jgi:predicted amidohydrolase YtcJ